MENTHLVRLRNEVRIGVAEILVALEKYPERARGFILARVSQERMMQEQAKLDEANEVFGASLQEHMQDIVRADQSAN